MFNPQDEKLVIDYIFGALDENEEKAVAQRLAKDTVFSRQYQSILAALRPILRLRLNDSVSEQTRRESKELTLRTMAFLRKYKVDQQNSALESASETAASEIAVSETSIQALDETRVEHEVPGEIPLRELHSR